MGSLLRQNELGIAAGIGDNSCGVIANLCGVIADPCGIVALPEAIGGTWSLMPNIARLTKHCKNIMKHL